jgi:hypothetical protein
VVGCACVELEAVAALRVVFWISVGVYAGLDPVSHSQHLALAHFIRPGGAYAAVTQGDLMWAPVVSRANRDAFETS